MKKLMNVRSHLAISATVALTLAAVPLSGCGAWNDIRPIKVCTDPNAHTKLVAAGRVAIPVPSCDRYELRCPEPLVLDVDYEWGGVKCVVKKT